jgi:hypothetical protein
MGLGPRRARRTWGLGFFSNLGCDRWEFLSNTWVAMQVPAPATGSYKIHLREQREIVEAALNGTIPHLVVAAPLKNASMPVSGPSLTTGS